MDLKRPCGGLDFPPAVQPFYPVFFLPLEPPSLFSFPLAEPVASGFGDGSPEAALPFPRYFADCANPLLRHWNDEKISWFREAEGRYPLVLFGGPGVGKSVLASTLAARLGGNVLSIAANEFVRLFREACETRSVPWFRERLDSADVLSIDGLDVSSLCESASREMIRVVDHYLDFRRPVLVTMTESPFAIGGEYASLASRLASGLSIEVNPPGCEARMAIVRQLCVHCDLAMDDDTIHWLIGQLPEDVSGLQREFFRMSLKAGGERPTAPQPRLGRRDLARLLAGSGSQESPIPFSRLLRVVARHYRMKSSELVARGRQRNRVFARSVAAWLVRKVYSLSYARIGQLLGKRDASTIRHACDSIEAARASDPALEHTLSGLVRQLRDVPSKGGKAIFS